MIEQVKLYTWYSSFILQILRLGFLIVVIFFAYQDILRGVVPKFPLVVTAFFSMIEIFFYFKLSRITPTITISQNNGSNMYVSCTKEVLHAFITHKNMHDVIGEIISYQQVRFLLERVGIIDNDFLKFPQLTKDQVVNIGFLVAKTRNGKFVTTIDVMAALLILTEPQTKLLFSHEIKEQDLEKILLWTTFIFPEEEQIPTLLVRFTGIGIGDSLIAGWTPETRKYTADITDEATRKSLLLLGREKEYQQIIESLIKQENNNVLLVGEQGVGKQTLVEALAKKSTLSQTPARLRHRRILELLVSQLLAGSDTSSGLEQRIQSIINEVMHAGNVMLYIPDFENILGSSAFNLDLSGAFMPYLKNGKMPIIGTITPVRYKLFLENHPIKEVFTTIFIPEVTEDIAMQMLFEKAVALEKRYAVVFTYRAIVKAVELANRYMQDSVMPGSSVRLLDDTASKIVLSKSLPISNKKKKLILPENIEEVVEEKTHIVVSMPKEEEKSFLLNLEDTMHKRLIGQTQAVSAIARAMRRLRSGLGSSNKPISFLFLGPTGVGKTETAKTLASLYFGGDNNMIRLDMSEYADDLGIRRLLGAPPGEGEDRGQLTERVHDNPFSLILLDEFEKADSKIHDLFLQVLDDGKLTDNKGKTVSFINTIIIATSNAASEFIRERVAKNLPIDKKFQVTLLEYLQVKRLFKPELLNRFDEIVTFSPLSNVELLQIIDLLLKELAADLVKKDITLLYDDKVLTKILTEGTDQQFGARPLLRYIQDTIENLIARKILQDEIKRGDKIILTVSLQNEIVFM